MPELRTIVPSYNRSFLERRGYFDRAGRDSTAVGGRPVEFAFDPDARLAYFEGVDPDHQRAVVSERQFLGRTFDFYWFWNPGTKRVAVYSRYGEQRWFVYDQSIGHDLDHRRRTEDTLEGIDDGLETVFDVRRTVDRFYRNLWDVRLDLARAFEVPGDAEIGDEARLMAAQRTIDRLIFCYVLFEANVIHGIDGGGNRIEFSPERVFDDLIERGELYAVLEETFFDHLNAPGWTEYEVADTYSITYPYLNEGLFRPRRIPTDDGGVVLERDLDASAYDWSILIEELNAYDWLAERSPTVGSRSRRKLSPAVIGQVFEKFVVTVSELSDEETLSLEELDRLDVSASGEQLLAGNRRVGAYYTPDYIACENTRETLWARVRSVLAEEHDVPVEELSTADRFFEELHAEDSSIPIDRERLEDVLANLTVLDPAVGSGAFLLTAGEVLERWRSLTNANRSRYDLRKEIVQNSLYGVDLLEGATEVCTLRLWLWLLSATSIDLDEGEPDVEPLPNVDANVRQGNSLLGVARPGSDSSTVDFTLNWTDGETKPCHEALEEYEECLRAYRVASGARASGLRARVTNQRRRLQEAFTGIVTRESRVRVTEEVTTVEAFRAVVAEVPGRVKCVLDFDAPMSDDARVQVAEAGFREQRNWPTTAYHRDVREVDPDALEGIFDLMDGQGTIGVERPVRKAEVEALDPFHWIFEFPMAFAPAGDGTPAGDDARIDDVQVAFDVVIGNPPHGSSLGDLEQSLLEERYALTRGGCEVAKLFLERSWELTAGELSYVVPKASTYNSNWEDFRSFCLEKLSRGVDLGRAFRTVDHEQVTIHLSRTTATGRYECGRLPDGAYHLEDSASIDRSFADALGTLPVSVRSDDQAVITGIASVSFPTLGELGIDAGRGVSTGNRTDEGAAPIAYNGKEVQRYFTRAPRDRVETEGLANATSRRVETPKVMAQNIIAHRKRPYDHLLIAAVYDPASSYTLETVTNVVVPEDVALSLPALAVLLNTRFVNWFVSVSMFNRAVRDMHLDSYFLERLILPTDLSASEQSTLADLYGLLAISGVASEYDLDPRARETYRELQSMANALAYELYLRDADRPLETDLTSLVAAELEASDPEYLEWYGTHLECTSEAEIADAFADASARFETATAVAASFRSERIVRTLEAVAAHPWVDVIERGCHRRGDRPLFGPFETP